MLTVSVDNPEIVLQLLKITSCFSCWLGFLWPGSYSVSPLGYVDVGYEEVDLHGNSRGIKTEIQLGTKIRFESQCVVPV